MPVYSPNPEYPDLPFAWPKSYGKTRDGRGWPQPLPRLLVVHHTAGAEHAQAAEAGAGYDQVRTDGTSAHYYIDPDSIVQCVPTWMRSNTAFYNGNTLGIHYELCGTLQSRDQWLDGNSRQTIRRAARQMARDAAKYRIPLRLLTTEQVRAGMSGICGHVHITYAFPDDNGSHTDPGPWFPWDVLLSDLQALNGDDMDPNGRDIHPDLPNSQVLRDIWDAVHALNPGNNSITRFGYGNPYAKLGAKLDDLLDRPPAAPTPEQWAELKTAVAADVKAAVVAELADLLPSAEDINNAVDAAVDARMNGATIRTAGH